ncbi:MAG: CapA family protein, partial [Methylomicrobium sp.]|nr:CapA family protein [Methylomicrobium sp.]
MQKNHSVAFGLIPASIDRISNISPENCLDIGFVGDVYARDDFLTEMGYGRLSDLRDAIWRPLSNTPLIVANLEAPITDKELAIEKKPYLHKTSTATLALFDERFVLSLANNHIMDYGASGLNDTIDALNKAGIQYAGAGQNLDQAKTPCLLTVEGIRIAVICAADPRFYPATETSPGTCPAHQSLLVESIQSIKNQVDFVIVSVHMGLEYVSVPSFNQMNLTQACFDAGTNVVHFHHAHCLSGAATNGKDMVFFGTGNY